MQNNLMHIENINSQLVVDSRLVAKELGITHKAFSETIRKYTTEIEQDFGQLPIQTAVVKGNNGGGNPEKFYYLNEDQATYLMTLSKNTPQVRACKRQLVKSFRQAKDLLNTPRFEFKIPEVTDITLVATRDLLQMFSASGDIQLAQVLKTRFGNQLLAENQILANTTELVTQYEGAVDVAIRLGFNVPSSYEGSLGAAVKRSCGHLLVGKNNRYSTASHKQVPANMYPACNTEVENAVRSYCVGKAFKNINVELID